MAENLNIVITADNTDALTKLNQSSQAVTNFGNKLKETAKPTADATNALSNLSRVAQDAPYGFMGIANNLNPLLESFQRLSKETGSAGSALKSMVSGLTGPAGIGLALGLISSLLVAFGDDISNFIDDLASAGGATKQMKDVISSIGNEFTTAAEKVNKVEIAFNLYHKGLLSGQEALKIYNKELGGILGIKNNINDAEKAFKDKTADYIEATLQRSLADAASKKAAEELLKQQELKLKGPDTTILDAFGGWLGSKTTAKAQKVAKERFEEDLSESQKIINGYKKIANEAATLAQTIANTGDIKLTTEKASISKNISNNTAPEKPQIQAQKEENNLLKEKLDYLNDIYKIYLQNKEEFQANSSVSRMRDLIDKQDRERTKKEGIFSERQGDIKLPASLQSYIEGVKKFDNDLKQAKDDAEKFAEVIARDVTGAFMSMFDAMQQGENPLQALGDYFTNLAKQIAAAAIQAALFQTILMAFGYGGDSFGTGFFEGFKKILGFAEGGIVSQPTIAMVGEGGQSEAIMPLNKLGNMMNSTFNAGAMSGGGNAGNGQFVLKGQDLILAINRSNASLNLRRGF